MIWTVVDFAGGLEEIPTQIILERRLTMPQPTQRQVVAESIPPRIDIELPPAPIVMTEQAVVSTTAAGVPLPPTTH